MNPIDIEVALELASHEGLVRQAYKDTRGLWTWSIGITSASGHRVERYIDRPQTLERCLAVYVWLLEQRYVPATGDAFRGRPLSRSQFAAALSFHYNTGAIARASWVRLWLAGDDAMARRAFMEWNRPAPVIPRRQKECALFFDGRWSHDGKITEFTRLTAARTPDPSSAVRRDIRAALAAVLDGTAEGVSEVGRAWSGAPADAAAAAPRPPRPADAPAAAFAGDPFPIQPVLRGSSS
ncbi:lysozyme [Ancylobacter oerskovii]|uniref:Lysozyme n=1 Tax=Ancylobacter oerskovii TaxID=459519 RepID=A0ABW4YZZ0_9HYPH|nr:hypothetical protein [Ancylobacter oerskovii]MBS7542996.1 hypothetical protein [Ancylobacter oerskovii]